MSCYSSVGPKLPRPDLCPRAGWLPAQILSPAWALGKCMTLSRLLNSLNLSSSCKVGITITAVTSPCARSRPQLHWAVLGNGRCVG